MKFRDKLKAPLAALFAVTLSLLASSAVILLAGRNPLTALVSIFQGSGWLPKSNYPVGSGQLTDILYTLDAFTPMLFASLSVLTAFHAGLFNIGVSGQMLLAGFVATITVGYGGGMRPAASFPLILLTGAAAGALSGGLIGLLKCGFQINEVVSSIMLNYAFQSIVGFFINTRYLDPVSRQSVSVPPNARLTPTGIRAGGYSFRAPWCLVLALACAALISFFFAKTVRGFEIKAVGKNSAAARYAGIGVGGNTVLAMVLSGALAGLAGVTYYLGYYDSIPPGTLSPVGFDAIAAAFLGGMNPFGAVVSGLLITSLGRGGTYMSSAAGVRAELSSLVTGLILLFSACSGYIRRQSGRYRSGRAAAERRSKG
ncbi:MAG: ABC transporter permease [Clostridium sp.]|jgi:simple sugar transport system permease protein|nr:ABC transporter permease [Clostridium sp.]